MDYGKKYEGRPVIRLHPVSVLPILQSQKKKKKPNSAQFCIKYSIKLWLDKTSKIVQYDNLLVNFAYFGAIMEKKRRRSAEFGAESSACRIGKTLTVATAQCTDEKKIVDLSFWVTVTFWAKYISLKFDQWNLLLIKKRTLHDRSPAATACPPTAPLSLPLPIRTRTNHLLLTARVKFEVRIGKGSWCRAKNKQPTRR